MDNLLDIYDVCLKNNNNWGINKLKRCHCKKCKNNKKTNKKTKNVSVNNYEINENLCLFCQKCEKYMLDRCRNCYQNYSKSIMNEKLEQENNIQRRKEEKEEFKFYLNKDIQKNSDQLLKYEKTNSGYKKYRDISKNIFKEIINSTNHIIEYYYFEKLLAKFLQKITISNTNNKFYLQLNICNQYSDSLIKILEKCSSNESQYLMLRIIYYLIRNNRVAMFEYNRDCGLLKHIKKNVLEQKISGEILTISETIISEFSINGFE